MANVSISLKSWSAVATSNQPDNSDAASIAGDLQAIQAGVRNIYSQDTIASATTCDLGSKDAGSLTISGTTTITGLGTVSAGIVKRVLFSGALLLTHNATSLILPSSANITTVANDTATFESLGAGNWRCTDYKRATGQALAGDATNLQSQTYTAFTTAGTAPAYTVATSPLYGAYAQFKRMFLKIHSGTLTGASTLNQDALGIKAIKQRDSTGAKIDAYLPANFCADIEYDGTDWVVLNPLPGGIGEYFAWGGNSTPSYGLLCNGAAVSRTTYAALFAKISTVHGAGDGSTTFNLPNVPDNYTLVQATSGEGTSTVGVVLAHTHTGPTYDNVSGASTLIKAGTGSATGTFTSSSTGGAANLAAGVKARICIRF